MGFRCKCADSSYKDWLGTTLSLGEKGMFNPPAGSEKKGDKRAQGLFS